MRNVTFISAGAGSGKTYSLTQQIVEFVKSGICSADEIILTTFTRAAAAELREKVRSALYKEGLYDAAMQIDNAAIGTIHSIAYQIVSRYWYLLGISADVRMIDEDDQRFYVMQSLSLLPDDGDLLIFRQMQRAFNITKKSGNYNIPDPDFWRADLRNIIEKISDYCIGPQDLDGAKSLSLQTVAEILNTGKTSSGEDYRSEVLEQAAVFEHQALNLTRLKSTTPQEKQQQIQKYIEEFKSATDAKMNDIEALNVAAYLQISKALTETKGFGKLCPDAWDFFETLPDRVLSDRRTYNLLASYIDIIYRLALVWQERYDRFKREHRILDFNDVQRYFAELLPIPEVAVEIQSRYKVALVDEFQDCSPQQVDFFKRLSQLMRQSVWVGDVKQSIYNFRGTDTELVRQVIDEAAAEKNGNTRQCLDRCWRSNETIVTLANNVFRKVFDSLPSELVELEMPDDSERPAERDLQHWHFKVGKAVDRRDALAYQVGELHRSQSIEYKDMAILCRNNDEVQGYAAALEKYGIPNRTVCDASVGGSGSTVFDLLTALVAVAANPGNKFSQALVAYYTEPGYTASKILSERLKHIESGNADKWLSDIGVFKRIENLKRTIGTQSVSSAVETLIVELNVTDIIRRMDSKCDAYDCCQIFIAAARRYEQQCTNLELGCSLAGFVDYVRQHTPSQSGDANGVTVSTYHKSKGLEWKCVILCSLDKEPVRLEKVFFGVNAVRDNGGHSVLLIPKGLASNCTDVVKERIKEHFVYKNMADAVFEESKRLMYVGMTRPKELLVTTSAITTGTRSILYKTEWLNRITGCDMPVPSGADNCFTWFGKDFRCSYIDFNAIDTSETAAEPEQEVEVLKQPKVCPHYDLRDIQPSRIHSTERLLSVEIAGTFSGRLNARANDADDTVLGNCIHHLMCSWHDDADSANTVARLADEYGVALDVGRFMTSARAFYAWLEATYGKPLAIEREVPFRFVREDGRCVNGNIDMLYRTSEGDVLIDYKSYAGVVGNLTTPASEFYTGKYSGQIAAYEEALHRSGRVVRDRLICYFSLGTAIRLIFNHK